MRAARRMCLQPRCGAVVDGGYCRAHDPHAERRRPNVDVRRWYRTPRWRALRASVLRAEPLCTGRDDGEPCGRPTTDVDHRQPHRGDLVLFWDRRNLQAKCHACHASKTAKGE